VQAVKPEITKSSRAQTVQLGQELNNQDQEESAQAHDLVLASNRLNSLIQSNESKEAARVKEVYPPTKVEQPRNKSVQVGASIAVGILLIAATVGVVHQVTEHKLGGVGGTKDVPAMPAQTVSIAKAQMRKVNDLITVTGSVSAWDPLNIGAEVSGLRLVAVNVEEGDAVHKGQTLALLNSALLKAQLLDAKAKLQSSEATWKKAVQPNRKEEILALRAAFAQSEAAVAQEEASQKEKQYNLTNAEINAKRYGELVQAGATSAADSETKQLVADTARDQLLSQTAKIKAAQALSDQNKQKMLEAERGGRSEDIDISRATIAEMQAQIQLLTEQIRQTEIKAPDDGVVSKRMAHIGEISTSGTPMFALIRANRLELRAQVPDIDIHRFQTGQKVAISMKEDEPTSIVGTVRLVSPQVDDVSRIGIVRIDLPANAGLKPGMFVRGEVNLGRRTSLTVPPQAVVRRNGESFVFTLNGNRAESRAVKCGGETDSYVEIQDGIKPGEVIISQGARFLSDRDVVKVSQ
jgi:HlyD family secretion protein